MHKFYKEIEAAAGLKFIPQSEAVNMAKNLIRSGRRERPYFFYTYAEDGITGVQIARAAALDVAAQEQKKLVNIEDYAVGSTEPLDTNQSQYLLFVVLDDHDGKATSPWIDQVRRLKEVLRMDHPPTCVLIWDYFPQPAYPSGFQMRNFMEGKKIEFMEKESMSFALTHDVKVFLAGHVSLKNEPLATSAPGQMARTCANIFGVF